MTNASQEEEVAQILAQVAASQASAALAVVSCGPAYLVWRREPGSRAYVGVAPKSAGLPREFRLSTESASELRRLGWRKPKSHRNWELQLSAENFDPAKVAAESLRILRDLYGVCGAVSCQISHDERSHPRNDAVYSAMRELAKTREHSHRTALYNALVNATVLVPVREDADDGDDGGAEFFVFEHHQGRPVFGVFTDIESLRMWNPRVVEYVPAHGSELFENLTDQRAAALLLNPEAEVGGHLNAHELETLAKAVQAWKRGSI